MTEGKLIEVREVVKNFKSMRALDNVSFDIVPAQITGILGENGAGKSTMLRILSGIMDADSGTIKFGGELVSSMTRRDQTTLLLGGQTGLYDELTALENILYFAKLRGLDMAEARKTVSDFAEQFKIDFLDKKANTLSTGMRQKTAIVRALIHDPKIIMLDEPESGLDFRAAALLNEVLREQARKGKTVIISSHSLGTIIQLCTEVVVLRKGCVIAAENLQSAIQGKPLHEAFAWLESLVVEHE